MSPPALANLLRTALTAHQAGHFAEADRLYRQVLVLQPRNFDALRFLGVLAGHAGKWAEGIKLLRDAVRVQPQSAEAHTDLGALLHGAGELDAAAKSLETGIRLSPQNFNAHHNLGVVRRDQSRFADAAASFGAAVGLRPDFVDAWYNLGIAWQAQGKYDDAITAYRRALHGAPERLDIHGALGGLLFEAGFYPAAADAYRAALAIQDDFDTALNGLAAAQAQMDDEKGIEAIERAIRAVPKNGYAYDLLGTVRRRQGRFADASAAYETALNLPGNHAFTYYGLSLLKKFTVLDNGVVDRMVSALDQPGLSASDRSSFHFALGKALDDLGRYAEAITHFDLANRAWLDARPPHRKLQSVVAEQQKHAAMTSDMIANFGPDEIERLRQWGSSSERPIFVVGMMRSGTTLVEQILASHPSVRAGGELKFWNDRRIRLQIGSGGRLTRRDAEEAISDYLDTLNGISPDATRVSDKMPHNFLFLGLIHVLFPNARIIHCRRNPVDTCLSVYFTNFAKDQDFTYDRGSIVFFYKEYRRLMAHWRRVLPGDRLIEIDYEQLVANHEQTSRRFIDFCGLEWNDACRAFHLTERSIWTASDWQARQPIYRTSAERWRHYEPWLGEFREFLDDVDPNP